MRILLSSVALLVVSFAAVMDTCAQTPIEIGDIIEGTLFVEQPAPEYVLSGTAGTHLSVICDTPDRDVDLKVTLLDRFGNTFAESTAMNFPEYWGAYLSVILPSFAEFTLKVEGEMLTERDSADFRLITREYVDDEPDGIALKRDVAFGGLISPAEDTDVYGIYLDVSKGPFWVTLRTPYDVLDGVLRVFTEDWAELGVNDNLIDTSPAVLINPELDGIYFITVHGAYLESKGPYEITVQTVWELMPEDITIDGIDVVGESNAYYFDLTTDQVFSIDVKSETPGFHSTFVFFDPWRRTITLNQSGESGVSGIYGYTPIEDGRYIAAVFGAYDEETGEYTLTSRLEVDEADGIELSPGDEFEAIVGPVGDTDTYTFDGAAGDRMSVWAWPSSWRLDPAVRLLGPSGDVVAENDDAVSVDGALISGVYLEETGTHTVEVLASPLIVGATGAAGPYIASITMGTGFDVEPPRVRLDHVTLENAAGESRITIATDAAIDDTLPMTATVTRDRTGETNEAVLSRAENTIIQFSGGPEEIFFMTIRDAADDPHATDPLLVPPATLLADEIGLPYGLAVRETGEVLFIDVMSGTIVEIDLSGSINAIIEGIETKGGLLGPNALAFDHEGMLYVSNGLTGEIVRFDSNGDSEAAVSGLNFPVALAFDASNRLHVCQTGEDKVVRVEADGSLTTITDKIRNPSDLAFGPNGDLYVTTNDSGNGTVFRIGMDGEVQRVVDPFTSQLDSLAFDTDGNLYVADGGEGWVWRLNPDGTLQKFAWGFPGPTDLAFGRGGQSDRLLIAAMGTSWDAYFASTLAQARTGRTGLPLPYSGTGIGDWWLR